MTSHFLWASRTTPLQNRGRNFVRSKRWPPYMSSTTSTYFCALTIRKHLSKVDFERSGRGQEPSRGHKFSILENVVLHRDFTSATLASFDVILLGRTCPKPCRVTIKFIIVPWTEYNTSFDDTLLLFLQKSNYLRWPVVRCNYFMSFHQSLDLVWKNTEHMIQ